MKKILFFTVLILSIVFVLAINIDSTHALTIEKEVSTVVVKPSDLKGWEFADMHAGETTFRQDATAPLGTGSLKLLTTIDNNDKAGLNSPTLDIPLSKLESLSYKTNQISATDIVNGNATIRIWLDLDGDGELDDQLMYEPYYNGFNGSFTTGWQTWTITPTSGKFWSNYNNSYNGLGGVRAGSYASNFTIDDVLAASSTAKIIGLSVTMGTWNPSQNVLVDAVNIVTDTEDITYDFDPSYSEYTVTIRPGDLNPSQWFFWDDNTDTIDNTLGSFVFGPSTAPLGNGSVEMAIDGSGRVNLATARYSGRRLADITTLQFSTYSNTGTTSPYLLFNVDFDGSDTWQKRLVYVPSDNGSITPDTWQTWDAIDGGNAKWQYSANWPAELGGGARGTTKTWNEIKAAFPNAGFLASDAFLGVRVGNPGPDGFIGNVDKFVIGAFNGTNILTETYDFEPNPLSYHNVTTVVRAADLISSPAPTGWFFWNDERDAIDNTLGTFVTGPMTAPVGDGSVQMTVTGTERKNIATYQFAGTKLKNITTLRFSTYSHTASGSTPSPYLHFNVDFDGSDTWQKRLIYVPSDNGSVTPDIWQEWDAIDGGNAKWKYSGANWPVELGGDSGETPKTWKQIVLAFPNIALRTTDAFLGIRVGNPDPDGFTGNVDNFVIGIKSGSDINVKIFDFEPTPAPVATPTTSGGGGGLIFIPQPQAPTTPVVITYPDSTTNTNPSSTEGQVLGATAYQFTQDMRLGSRGPEVKALQKFLNLKGFTVSETGAGSLGNETEFFGVKTKAALIKYQEANPLILTNVGITNGKGTGNFFFSTRGFVNEYLLTDSAISQELEK